MTDISAHLGFVESLYLPHKIHLIDQASDVPSIIFFSKFLANFFAKTHSIYFLIFS